jgi:hypothetical protein
MAGVVLLACIVYACNDTLSIQQDYAFDWQVMPYQTKITQGETVEIRCKITKDGNYKEALYYIRYFQPSGKGELRLDDGRTLTANDLLPLPKEEFRLYYTSHCTDQQTIDVYIEDTFGKVVQLSFNFQNQSEKEEPISLKYTFETLPVPSTISLNDTVEIRCRIVKEDINNTSTYSVRYFQPLGKGKLLFQGGVELKPNDLYRLDNEAFNLYYVSNSTARQTIDVYIVDDNGQTVQKSFSFENAFIEPEPEIDYGFEFETLPVPKSVVEGETVEIRCQIKRADSRNDKAFSIRYFQFDGKGELRLDNGRLLVLNDLFVLGNDVFRLYYTSKSAELQTIEVCVENSFGQVVKKTFSFTGIPSIEADDDTSDETETDSETPVENG